ncbi:Hypothetical protein CINCED_3A013190 [Cinara cedri]|uniref:Alpha-mannosidase n=1 Tax=Cinara cedri TaxID=506608 RepID=A0A5E4NJT2_9HEMI|nr:Hypothetical protein CINCED_3A013190 [Cinara cedri]
MHAFFFQPDWILDNIYWTPKFDTRYQTYRNEVINKQRLPVKIFVVPHSHNDPGWLKTFEDYYESQTSHILNYMVDKMMKYKDMTFIWSEISFFSLWWKSAHPDKKKVVHQLLAEGRLEITTGGWVMTDEAASYVYSMLDQLIEGHQWIKNNLGIDVKTGWSVDPFGHGPTVPYLLKNSKITDGTIIQRIHYSWKEWFAWNQNGDFFWRQNWDRNGHTDILVHQLPFEIYTIKDSCGPNPKVCVKYDFKKIKGEKTDDSRITEFINDTNVKEKADQLMEQYFRTASVSIHNVGMVALGDDFRYDHEVEWDQQYTNYEKLFKYINANKERYHGAEVSFGTPSEFFKELRRRSDNKFPTLRGDFFVYSEVSWKRPVYWSGYFTSRPYWKVLDRELEANLRSAEILYTFAVNNAQKNTNSIKLLNRQYEHLVKARQNLALFQHHDAITGTSKAFVMNDYGLKLFEGIQSCMMIQSHAIHYLLLMNQDSNLKTSEIVVPDNNRRTFDQLTNKLTLEIHKNQSRKIVVFNPHGRKKTEPIKVLVSQPNVQVVDIDGLIVKHQINPVWSNINKTNAEPLVMSETTFELFFIAVLEPLSLTTFTIHISSKQEIGLALVYCTNCEGNSIFYSKNMESGDIHIENDHLKVMFDGTTGLMSSVVDKSTGKPKSINIDFLAYRSVPSNSGAYLFKPNPEEAENNILKHSPSAIIIITGPISSEITVFYNLLTHTVRLYHQGSGIESRGLYVENVVNYGPPPNYMETELIMRLSSDVRNGNPAVIYTDSNGFQMQKRVTTRQIGIEGNYFPVTSMTYIEDDKYRLTVLVNHAQGVAGWEPGRIEFMLDRRTKYDDGKGMKEGVEDNKMTLTKYWILLETVSDDNGFYKDHVSNPSLVANLLSEALLYPANVFFVEPLLEHAIKPKLTMINKAMPCDCHLMNLRSLTEPETNQFPSQSAFMVLHRKGYDCRVNVGYTIEDCHLRRDNRVFSQGTGLSGLDNVLITKTTLTGTHKLNTIDSFDLIQMTPMDLSVFNVTFIS